MTFFSRKSEGLDRSTVVKTYRLAAIDIGTVTCRLLIADAFTTHRPDGSMDIKLKEVAKRYEVTNLGEGVDATHELMVSAIDRVVETLKEFKRVMVENSDEDHPICKVTVMSTSAARDAKNSQVFADRLNELGLSLDVIAGSKEAALSFSGATRNHAGVPAMVVDVGGGSTEISIGIGGEAPLLSRSFDIGCRRVTERFLHSDPPSPHEMQEARDWIREQFVEWFLKQEAALPSMDGMKDVDGESVGCPKMIAVAGTATSAVSIRDHMEVYDPALVDGACVSDEELHGILDMLQSIPLSERERVVGLDPRRAPVIVAGMLILSEVMKAAGKDGFYVSESDILEGMILDAAKQLAEES